MVKKQQVASAELLYGLSIALCFFAFKLSGAFINERCAVVLGSGAVNAVYTFGLVCTGAGFLSFPLLFHVCKAENARRAALLIAGSLCLAAAAILWRADRPAVFLASAIAALLLNGHIGGCVYYNTAMHVAGSRHTGRMIGAGMGAAILNAFGVYCAEPAAAVHHLSPEPRHERRVCAVRHPQNPARPGPGTVASACC